MSEAMPDPQSDTESPQDRTPKPDQPHGSVLYADWFDAMMFDLDGVITNSTLAHGVAWKQVLDAFLHRYGTRHGVTVAPFDAIVDYHDLVDGKPRYDGARSFLHARGVEIPFGEPTDSEDTDTCCDLGNRKNRIFLENVDSAGLELYPSTVSLMRALNFISKRIAVVSASKNAEQILDKARLLPLVDVMVSGREATAMSLAGKPAPDTYIAAANMLGVSPCRAVVFEDSVTGVRAGADARVGMVVGINRGDDEVTLVESGADVLVNDLGELVVDLGHGHGFWPRNRDDTTAQSFVPWNRVRLTSPIRDSLIFGTASGARCFVFPRLR